MVVISASYPAPKSLESLCFECLVAELDWQDDYAEYILDYLPQVMLIELLRRTNKGQIKGVPGAMRRGTSASMALGRTQPVKQPLDMFTSLLHATILNRCSHIRELELTDLFLGEELWCELIGNLKTLTCADLTRTDCTDEVLRVISFHGSELDKLMLQGCSRISDAGLAHLCPNPLNDKQGCPKLTLLNVKSTNISLKCLCLLIWQLPEMKHLYSLNTNVALCELYHADTKPTWTVNLCHLDNFRMSPEDFKTCLKIAKKVTSLCLYPAEGVRGSAAKDCWNHLKELLEPHGAHLTSLLLSEFALDALYIYPLCPHLENFGLKRAHFRLITAVPENITTPTVKSNSSTESLSIPLKEICLSDCGGLSDEVLFVLLSEARNLRKLVLLGDTYPGPQKRCTVTDAGFRKLLAHNPMKHLEEVKLSKLPDVGLETLRLLLPPVGYTQNIRVSSGCDLPSLSGLREESARNGWILEDSSVVNK